MKKFSGKSLTFSRIALVLILGLSFFLRAYHVDELLNFFHDQGRDALVVKRMLVDKKMTLLGPQTTAKGVYLGPLYYYMGVVPLAIFGLNPIGIDYMVCLFGVLSVLVCFLMVKDIYGEEGAYLASGLYGVSAAAIGFSNHAWNPNPLPFFMMLFMWGFYRVVVKKDSRFWIGVFIGIGAGLQIHLFCVILVFVTFWVLLIKKIKIDKWFYYGLGVFLILLAPWGLFELRHGFLNTKNLANFLSEGKVGVGAGVIERIAMMFSYLSSYLGSSVVSLVVMVGGLVVVMEKRKEFFSQLVLFLFVGGLLVVGFYKGIYQNYHGLFLSFLPFVFFGGLVSWMWKKKEYRYFILGVFIYLVFINLRGFSFEKNYEKRDGLQKVSRFIVEDVNKSVKEEKFNLVSFTNRFDHNAMDYRYFVEIFGRKADELSEYEESDFLYVIDEIGEENILENGVMEMESFSKGKILDSWSFCDEVKLYKIEK